MFYMEHIVAEEGSYLRTIQRLLMMVLITISINNAGISCNPSGWVLAFHG